MQILYLIRVSWARHLNLMDKIRSHVNQTNSNPLSLNSKVSNARASNSEISDSEVSEASDPKVSNSSPRSRIRWRENGGGGRMGLGGNFGGEEMK
jgi:hypothetical protein